MIVGSKTRSWRGKTRGVTWHGGRKSLCVCFGSEGKLREERKKGGDVTGLLKLFSWFPQQQLATVSWVSVCEYYSGGI